jgi:site-specific DNA recombinase
MTSAARGRGCQPAVPTVSTEAIWVEDQNRAFRNEADYHLARQRLEFFGGELWNARGPIGRVEGSFYAMMDALTLVKLADATRRGMFGIARAGKNAGGKAYGYRAAGVDQPGVLLIDESQAAIVRRIFAEYVAGAGPRSIASDLNRDGVLPPRGNHWNASTIAGSRARFSGILFNPIYDGRVIWNRQRFRKHPDTRTRQARVNDPADWVEAKAEHLRIIDAATFKRAQVRKDSTTQSPGAGRKRGTSTRYLLSGLIRCGTCASNFTANGLNRHGQAMFACSRARESGTCDHKRRIRGSIRLKPAC